MEMNKFIIESATRESLSENEFLISLENILKSIEDKLQKFVKSVPKLLTDPELDSGLRTIEIEGEKIHDFLRSVVQPYLNSRKDETEPDFQYKYEQMEEQLHIQATGLEKAIEEIQSLKIQILNQSNFCASLGAVLGNLAWRASRFPEIVDIWLSGVSNNDSIFFTISYRVITYFDFLQNKVREFLSIVSGSFVAFISTYETGIPPTNNVEYQFVLGLLGIVTNISSIPKGREFLITNQNGRDLVEKIIKFMPNFFPIASGKHSLMRLMLMILYNVSMNNTGLSCLFEFHVAEVLSRCLEEDTLSEELQLLCLRILQSITYNLKDPKYIEDLTTSISIRNIKNIALNGESETSSVAKEVIKQLQESLRSKDHGVDHFDDEEVIRSFGIVRRRAPRGVGGGLCLEEHKLGKESAAAPKWVLPVAENRSVSRLVMTMACRSIPRATSSETTLILEYYKISGIL
ncbi:heat shock factor 2-binding protein-like [Vespula squamosa]|uniref:Heat shock factor 2-binding protein-like n=1 Tax=Vespula squamosa TaxID=30214 RepID=A0ABD2B769_VESSQ